MWSTSEMAGATSWQAQHASGISIATARQDLGELQDFPRDSTSRLQNPALGQQADQARRFARTDDQLRTKTAVQPHTKARRKTKAGKGADNSLLNRVTEELDDSEARESPLPVARNQPCQVAKQLGNDQLTIAPLTTVSIKKLLLTLVFDCKAECFWLMVNMLTACHISHVSQ